MTHLAHAILSANLAAAALAIRKPGALRSYLGACARAYRQARGKGLRPKDPFAFLGEKGWADSITSCRLPSFPSDDSGTGWDEQYALAQITAWLKPVAVFEFGTYNGRTTAIFSLNSNGLIHTLDLPPGKEDRTHFESDRELTVRRRTGYIAQQMGLQFQQILCNSFEFDPLPYTNSIELGFIDGGHTYEHVKNDTEKMAVMASHDRGLCLWHDYGGVGQLAGVTHYLDELSSRIPVHVVGTTSLAWCAMSDLAKLG